MEYINSKDNRTVKHISKLVKDSKYRKRSGAFTVEGIRLCDDAIRSKINIDTFIYTEDAYRKYKDKIDAFIPYCNRVCICSEHIFSSICDTKTPQGVLFVIKALDKCECSGKMNKENGIVLALENIQDPSNLGTILRSAEAFGVDRIVMSDNCCDIYSPKVIRGSMGALFRIEFEILNDLPKYINDFNSCGTSYAAILDRDSKHLKDMTFEGRSLIAIGNEGSGLTEDTSGACSEHLFIDMKGSAESLNAGVAAGIILWEMSKYI